MNARAATAAPPPPVPGEGRLITFPRALAIYLLLAIVYFLPAFLPGKQLFGSDFLAGGYFFEEFLSNQFMSGHLPEWVPFIYGGLPLHANPGSAYYPIRFLVDLFFSVSRIWPALFIAQFTLAGIGMYLLARELEVRPWAAFIAGLAFEFTGLMMSWVLGGQEGRIIVATLAPMVFFFLHRAIRTAELRWFAGAAASIGFALLSFQIQNAYYLLLAALLWSIFAIWNHGVYRSTPRLTKVVLLGLAAVAFAFALSAVNFLPFAHYINASPRAGPGRGYDYSTSFSMPLGELSAVAVPELIGFLGTYHGSNPFKLHVEYLGATVLLLLVLGAYFSRRNRHWWFFGGLGLFALSIAFGGNTPLYRIYYAVLPFTEKFRAPSLAFFLVSMCVAAMAALTLEAMTRAVDERMAARHRPIRGASPGALEVAPAAIWLLGGALVVAFVLGAAAAGGANGAGPAAYRFPFFAVLVALVLWFFLRGGLRAGGVLVLLGLITVTDLWVMDRNFFRTAPGPDQLFASDDVVDFLKTQPGHDRVWVLPFPPGGIYHGQADDFLMHFGIDQAGGEHPDPLQSWLEFVGEGQQTMTDWHNFAQYPAFMRAANVRYLVSGVPLSVDAFKEVHRGTAGFVYENVNALPRAYLVPAVESVANEEEAIARMQQPGFDPAKVALVSDSAAPVRLPAAPLQGNAQLASYEPDRVVVKTQASRPALLVLADNYYQGWRADLENGKSLQIVRTDGTLRGVVVPAGAHTVTFHYEPTDLYVGLTIYLVGMGLLVLYALFLIARRARTGPPAAEP